MAQRSTAKFVSYDLRPGKQIERKMMLDSFGAAIESGFGLSEYRYVGMGGNRFYDFILVHKYLGIEKMVSLEYDKRMLPRVLYNLPYNFIDVKNLDVQEFLARDRYAGNTIYWMDYDGSIGTNVTGDVASLAPRVKSGDFVFTTVCGAPPKRFRKMNSKERVEEVKEMFRELGESVTKEDMEDAQFAIGVDKILNAAFTNAFAARRGSAFRPFFQVGYKDGQDMVTFGGVLASAEEFKRFSKMLKHRCRSWWVQSPRGTRSRSLI